MLRASNFRGNFIGLIAQKKMVQVRKLTCNAGYEVGGRCGSLFTFGFGGDGSLHVEAEEWSGWRSFGRLSVFGDEAAVLGLVCKQ